ncbi:MAG: dihydropteroate synthase [Chloroflexi bacterium]|nr:dihydropteroate synthase [Chloroflexota bacterium]
METDETNLPLPPTRCRDTEFRWGERTYVMGILNISPDSFSGDGLGDDMAAIVSRAKRLADEGADIIDIGGESTRPGAQPISADEELRRIIPAIERLAVEISVPISVDTYKSEVASRAIKAGANMVNDVWGLKRNPKLAEVAAGAGVPVILVSNQRDNPGRYDIMIEVISSLKKSIGLAESAGVAGQNIIIDPGIGFGKSAEQNLAIIRRLAELKALGKPILVGSSRKLGPKGDRKLEATAATVAIAIARGADMVRVHDVKEMVTVARMSDAIIRKGLSEF